MFVASIDRSEVTKTERQFVSLMVAFERPPYPEVRLSRACLRTQFLTLRSESVQSAWMMDDVLLGLIELAKHWLACVANDNAGVGRCSSGMLDL